MGVAVTWIAAVERQPEVILGAILEVKDRGRGVEVRLGVVATRALGVTLQLVTTLLAVGVIPFKPRVTSWKAPAAVSVTIHPSPQARQGTTSAVLLI